MRRAFLRAFDTAASDPAQLLAATTAAMIDIQLNQTDQSLSPPSCPRGETAN